MLSQSEIESVLDYIKDNQAFLDYNQTMFEITEGDLLTKVVAELKKQFSGSSGHMAAMRASPINCFNKVNHKLSKLYIDPPKRKVMDGNETNQQLVDFYSPILNESLQCLNFNYNAYKSASVEIFHNEKKKALAFRPITGHLFLPRSTDQLNPMEANQYIKFMGVEPEKKRKKYWVYTDDSFTPILEDGSIYMPDIGETEGVNLYGTIPFGIATRSKYLLVPIPDRDVLQMTILIPLLITDINFGSMFLSHPILYGIGINADNLKISPDHFWNVKPDRDTENPSVGVLKAEPNLESMMNNATSQLAMWLDSRNIKPGSVGKMTAENFASGISKIISEMDTIEDRRMQAQTFKSFEIDFWRKIAQIHNYLAPSGLIEQRMKFIEPEKMIVNVEFQEERIFESRQEKIARLKIEVDSRFTSREMAIKELNPSMTDDAIDELLEEIEEENGMAESENQDTRELQT